MAPPSKQFGWETTGDDVVKAFADQVAGRTFVITGPSINSIGAETAYSLARHGSPATIILLGRDASKINPVIAEIASLNPSISTLFVPIELSDPASIRTAAHRILSDPAIAHIDVLINSAGVMVCPYTPVPHWKDPQGRPLEMQFAVNHVGHFLLTNLLLPKIRGGRGARVVNVSSMGHRFGPVNFEDLGWDNGKTYDPWTAYGQSKTANILMAAYLAAKIPAHEVASFSLNPGSIPTGLSRHLNEDLVEDAMTRLGNLTNAESIERKTIQQGSATDLVAALDPALQSHSGAYLSDCQFKTAEVYASDSGLAEKLWKVSEGIVEEKFEL